jgi:uncharacterized membrane protein
MHRTVAWAFLLAVAVGWSAAILAAPRIRAATDGPAASRLAAMTYVVGAVVCHQRPERSFHIAGAQMPVCARCTALYLAGAVGLLAWPFVRRAMPATRASFIRALIVAGVPTAITLATGAIGLWDPPNGLRAAVSAPLGLVLGAVLAAVTLEDLR